MQVDHLIDWSNFLILKVETNYFRRLNADIWFINSYVNVINGLQEDDFPKFIGLKRFNFLPLFSSCHNDIFLIFSYAVLSS